MGVMKERVDNRIMEEEKGEPRKKVKPNTEEEVKVCPLRRKGAPDDEECLACGS